MPRTDLDPTAAPEGEALIADAVSRALESHAAGTRTGMRLQITEAGHEVTTLDVVVEGGELLLVMEYVSGEALSGLLQAASRRKQPCRDDFLDQLRSLPRQRDRRRK